MTHLQVYLVVNLLLAALYDAWKEAHEYQLQKRRVRQYHALIAAYLEVGHATSSVPHHATSIRVTRDLL